MGNEGCYVIKFRYDLTTTVFFYEDVLLIASQYPYSDTYQCLCINLRNIK